MSALEPRKLAHYIAACTVAQVSPATISSSHASAVEMRACIEAVSSRSIPDAARWLCDRFGAL